MDSAQRLADVLGQVMAVGVEEDGALTVRHDGTFASFRTVTIADGLELISLTQVLAWDLTPDDELRKSVAALTARTMLGTVTLVENALRTLVMMILASGADVRRALPD